MSNGDFILLGHNSPLGQYPAPVVPVGRLNNQLVAIYATEVGSEIARLALDCSYVKHDLVQQHQLAEFDLTRHRLFARSEQEVLLYSIEHEKDFFLSLLREAQFSSKNPFFRLSLAKATKDVSVIANELLLSANEIVGRVPHYLSAWLDEEKRSIFEEIETTDTTVLLNLIEGLYSLESVPSVVPTPVSRETTWLAGVERWVSKLALWIEAPLPAVAARGENLARSQRYLLLVPDFPSGPVTLEATLERRANRILTRFVVLRAPEGQIYLAVTPENGVMPTLVNVRAGYALEENFPSSVERLILCVSHDQYDFAQYILIRLPVLSPTN